MPPPRPPPLPLKISVSLVNFGFGDMAVLVGMRQLDVSQDDALLGECMTVLVLLQQMETCTAKQVRFALDPLHLMPVVEAQARRDIVVLVVGGCLQPAVVGVVAAML